MTNPSNPINYEYLDQVADMDSEVSNGFNWLEWWLFAAALAAMVFVIVTTSPTRLDSAHHSAPERLCFVDYADIGVVVLETEKGNHFVLRDNDTVTVYQQDRSIITRQGDSLIREMAVHTGAIFRFGYVTDSGTKRLTDLTKLSPSKQSPNMDDHDQYPCPKMT